MNKYFDIEFYELFQIDSNEELKREIMKFELNSKHENVIRMVALQNDNSFPNRTIIQKAFEIKELKKFRHSKRTKYVFI